MGVWSRISCGRKTRVEVFHPEGEQHIIWDFSVGDMRKIYEQSHLHILKVKLVRVPV